MRGRGSPGDSWVCFLPLRPGLWVPWGSGALAGPFRLVPTGWWSRSRQGRSPVPRQVVPDKVGAKQLGPGVRLAASSAPLAPLSIMSSLRSPVEGPMPGEVLCLSLQRVWGWWHRAGRARAQPCLLASQPVCGILMSSAQCTASVCRDCLLPPCCLCSLLRCLGYFMSSFGCQAPSPSPWFPEVSHHLLYP